MCAGVLTSFLRGLYLISAVINLSVCVEKWNMHEHCGHHLEGYGGEIYFDSNLLPPGTSNCHVTIVGNGTEDNMLSLYFTSYNVSEGCLANITLKEDSSHESAQGLYQSFCTNNPYLNEYLIYTTNGRFLSLIYTRRMSTKSVRMIFDIKYVTFVSRVTGCTEEETVHHNMVSCKTGRCVHNSLVCQDLNPCGDHSDCGSADHQLGKQDSEGKGLSYIKIVIVTIVVVFGVFASIQICLIVRNEHKMCHWKDPKVRIDAELMYIPNGEVRKAKEMDGVTLPKKDPDSESLIIRDPA